MQYKMGNNIKRNTKKPKINKSNIETLKRQLNLTDSKTSTKIVLKVLRCSGNNLTRSKLLISRFIADLEENDKYTPEPSKIVMNLNKEINNINKNKRNHSSAPYGKVETKTTIPTCIVYLKSKGIK